MFLDLQTDVRYALRALWRERGFALTAILTLGLGIGLTTGIFSVVDSVLLRPVPWPEPDRLIRLEERRGGQRGRSPWTITNGSYNAWRENASTLDGLAAWRSTGQTLRGVGEAERLLVTATSPSLFTLLRAQPIIGRLFVQADAEPGRRGTAILSHGLWQQRFGGDRAIVGRTIRLDDDSYEVVGVMPNGFAFPNRETRVWLPFEPLRLMSGDGRQMRIIVVEAIARLKPTVMPEQAAAEATSRARGVPDIRQAALSVFGATGDVSIAAVPVEEVLTNEVRPAITVLFVGVAMLLFASTANVVNVQLTRATMKRREAGIRTAIGAGVWRMARLWLVESAILGAVSGTVGIGLAAVVVQVLPALLPPDFPKLDDLALQPRGVAFALVTTLLISMLCGCLPALFVRSTDISRDLSADGQAQYGLSARTPTGRLQTWLVMGQVASACVLLIGGALLARSFGAMLSADRGYDAMNLLTARLTLPHEEVTSRRIQFLEELQDRLRALPRVRHVAFGNGLPLLGNAAAFGRNIPSPDNPTVTLEIASTWRVVSPTYIPALQLRMVAGRPLAEADTADSPKVIVVNRAFATRYLGPNAVGRRLQLGLSSGLEWEVAGVTDDVRVGPLTDPIGPEFLVSYRQAPTAIAFDPVLLIRTDDDPANHAQTVRSLVRQLDPSAAVDSLMTMENRVMRSLDRPRAYAVVLATLAAMSLAISVVGVFGLLSYTTARRTQEIGIRIAVGAGPRAIAALILRQALGTIAAGLAIGVVMALVFAESVSKLVYGVATRDLASFVLAPVLLALLALAAAALPARTASRLDPVRALRSN